LNLEVNLKKMSILSPTTIFADCCLCTDFVNENLQHLAKTYQQIAKRAR